MKFFVRRWRFRSSIICLTRKYILLKSVLSIFFNLHKWSADYCKGFLLMIYICTIERIYRIFHNFLENRLEFNRIFAIYIQRQNIGVIDMQSIEFKINTAWRVGGDTSMRRISAPSSLQLVAEFVVLWIVKNYCEIFGFLCLR